ncbi:hypothetical protein SAMN05445850_7579 [Paraburkholderia tuberum]|uniref:Uncharacterized protein n=1 Tax=Paraburkholderia tuberum TaxID=157910 RepID=A0A1H1KFQ4_9BURK|nr:hypothetical protein SAMN05445850_7579 [Paraburkholderia tuberum]
MFVLTAILKFICDGLLATVKTNGECLETEAGAICFIFF